MKMGEALGYQTSLTFSKDPQGDAIWFSKVNKKIFSSEKLPLVAFEILCSETPKSIKGSISTLRLDYMRFKRRVFERDLSGGLDGGSFIELGLGDAISPGMECVIE